MGPTHIFPRAVLWDLDGTLVDSEPIHQRALVELLLEVGCQPPPRLDAMLIGMSIDEVHEVLLTLVGLRLPLAEFARRRAEAYVTLRGDLRARPGALGIVAGLAAAGVPQAIVSNSERLIVETNIVAVGLKPLGLPTVSRSDVNKPKPDPEPYRHAAALLGVEASVCVVVEDSPTGVRAGLTAGSQVIAWPEPGSDLAFDPAATRVESADALRAALSGRGLA